MARYDGAEIYIRGVSRMVTIKHTTNRVYFTGYYKFEGEWSKSWIIETTMNDITHFGLEEI